MALFESMPVRRQQRMDQQQGRPDRPPSPPPAPSRSPGAEHCRPAGPRARRQSVSPPPSAYSARSKTMNGRNSATLTSQSACTAPAGTTVDALQHQPRRHPGQNDDRHPPVPHPGRQPRQHRETQQHAQKRRRQHRPAHCPHRLGRRLPAPRQPGTKTAQNQEAHRNGHDRRQTHRSPARKNIRGAQRSRDPESLHPRLRKHRKTLRHRTQGHRGRQTRPHRGARFTGKVLLSDLDPPNGYTISGEGQGGVAGFAKGGAHVSLLEEPGGTPPVLHRQRPDRRQDGPARRPADRLDGEIHGRAIFHPLLRRRRPARACDGRYTRSR